VSQLGKTALLFGAAVAQACEPKEARDPADIIAEDPSFLEPRYSELEAEETASASPTPAGAPGEPPATYEDCKRAVTHLEALGIDLAIAEESDPDRKRSLEADKADLLRSPAVQRRINDAADECVLRGTSKREAQCIASIDSPEDIDRCE
jgi:hypothetical protein